MIRVYSTGRSGRRAKMEILAHCCFALACAVLGFLLQVQASYAQMPPAPKACEQNNSFAKNTCNLVDIVSTDPGQKNKNEILAEPSIAIDPTLCNKAGDMCTGMVISTFDGIAGNRERWSNGPACKDRDGNDSKCAPLWVSSKGGAAWTKRYSVPSPAGLAVDICPCDTTLDYLNTGILVGAFLADDDSIYTGTTSDPSDSRAWFWKNPTQRTNINSVAKDGSRDVDQPWVAVSPFGVGLFGNDVNIAYSDFNASPTAVRAAATQSFLPLDFRTDTKTGSRESLSFSANPGHRVAADQRFGPLGFGFVYSYYQSGVEASDGCCTQTIDFKINRTFDGGMSYGVNGESTGVVVARHASDQPGPGNTDGKFGWVNALRGGVDSLGVDPRNGDVYVVYADRDSASGSNALDVLRLSTLDNGRIKATGGPTLLTPLPVQAALPAVAVAADGSVGVLYDIFEGQNDDGFSMFTVHLAISINHGATFTDNRLLTFTASAKSSGNRDLQRLLGDFSQLRAVGRTFYGAFSADADAFGRKCNNMSCKTSDAIFLKATLK